MSEGNGAVEALHRIEQAEVEQRTLKEEVRALVVVVREQNAKLDHIATLIRAHGAALDWLVKAKKTRRKKAA